MKTLVTGYGAATLIAAAIYTLTAAPVAAALALWIGGAILSLALAAATAGRRARAVAPGADDAALAAALRRWEEDRLADTATGQRGVGARADARR